MDPGYWSETWIISAAKTNTTSPTLCTSLSSYSATTIWKANNVYSGTTLSLLTPYILKAKKFAEPPFQSKKICGKSA